MPHVQANGINLYYEERGTGEPLLLIMGITAPGAVWEKHVAHWESSFRCILYDNRGIGQTDKPAGPYTSAQLADDAAGLLEALNISSARVAGVSMGGIIAQQLALRHPERVRSMVLMCPWARCDRPARATFQHMMHAKRLRPEEFANYMQLLIYHPTSWADDTTYEALLEAQQTAATEPYPQPLHGLEGQAHACMDHDVLADLPQIQQPCLVIGGEDDRFVPVALIREVADAIPNAELHLYEQAAHVFHWEKIDDFNPRALQWLQNH